MRTFIPIRGRRRSLRGLGYPVFPDSFNSAAGESFSFSPNTPDSIVMSVLAQNNQQLPPNLAAAWAAAQGAGGNISAPTAAVASSGTPVSTQTAAPLSLSNILSIAPGIFQCTMSDGSAHYCDVDGNPISYTPPAATPAVTPAAASLPTAVVAPAVTPLPASTPAPGPAPVAVSPSGVPVSTVTGTTPATAPAAMPATSGFDFSSITTWLSGSMFAGIPNWILLAGGGVALFALSGDGSSSPRRR